MTTNAPTTQSTAAHPTKMTYPVLAEAVAGGWVAMVPGWTQAKAIGITREAAIAQLQQWLAQQFAHSNPSQQDLTQLEIEISPHPDHPAHEYATALAHNPLFDEMLAEVEAYRQSEREIYFQSLDATETAITQEASK
jgi:predicted RNase H-like HicB family nuclease